MENIDWNLGELLQIVIVFSIFAIPFILADIFVNWMEKQIDKYPGKYPFWEDTWSHDLNG